MEQSPRGRVETLPGAPRVPVDDGWTQSTPERGVEIFPPAMTPAQFWWGVSVFTLTTFYPDWRRKKGE